MTISEATKSCFRKYVTFSGRATRSEFWWFFLFGVLVSTVWGAIAGVFQKPLGIDPESMFIRPSLWASVILILPATAVQWRRLHDIGLSGWWTVVIFVTGPVFGGIVGGLIGYILGDPRQIPQSALLIAKIAPIGGLIATVLMIYILTRPSQPGPNKYGPNPHEVTQ